MTCQQNGARFCGAGGNKRFFLQPRSDRDRPSRSWISRPEELKARLPFRVLFSSVSERRYVSSRSPFCRGIVFFGSGFRLTCSVWEPVEMSENPTLEHFQSLSLDDSQEVPKSVSM